MTTDLTKTARFFTQLEQWRNNYFPERQLFLRSQGRVRFLTIHSYTQIAMASGVLVAIGWGLVTSYAYLSRDHVIEGKNNTISAISAEYQTLSSDFSALEAEVERRANLLEERQQFLQDLIGSAPVDTPSLLPIPSEDSSNEPTILPETNTSDIEEQESTADKLSFFDGLFNRPQTTVKMPSNSERRKALLARLQKIEETQREVATRLEAAVNQKVQSIDQAIKPSEISVNILLAKAEAQDAAVGGPFVPELSFEGVFEAKDGAAFEKLRENFDRLKNVTNALNSYPHGKPADKYYISSRFGGRIDPIKKVRARHYALDLSGWPGEPIKATAPGKVVKSGSIWPYGNMVEIDHGNGFRTRYGHMRKLNVKKDEEVKFGQQLGEMGSTGRVTGTHVHYEVWFDDKVRDPMPFMKAAANVLKIQGRNEETYE